MEEKIYNLPLIGDKAPHFEAVTTMGNVTFPEDYKGKWVVLFSHPADFTPVCTTEFITFQSFYKDFQKLNCDLIGLSIDSVHSHIAWVKAIESIEYRGNKNMKIEFPIIDDIKMNVAGMYGMVQPNASTTQAVRAVFIIDDKGIIRTILYYPLSTGRNFPEILRIIESLQRVDKNTIATGADWQPGDKVIIPSAKTIEQARDRKVDGKDCQAWFLCFKDDEGK